MEVSTHRVAKMSPLKAPQSAAHSGSCRKNSGLSFHWFADLLRINCCLTLLKLFKLLVSILTEKPDLVWSVCPALKGYFKSTEPS